MARYVKASRASLKTAGLHNRAADAPIPPLRGNRGGAKASPLLPFGTRARGLAASGFCIDACELPVLSYLQERGSSLQPFLFIAAISATRRILAIGAQVSEAGRESLAGEISGGHDRSGPMPAPSSRSPPPCTCSPAAPRRVSNPADAL